MLAGIGGSLFVVRRPRSSAPSEFNINLSITFLVAVVVGGAATIIGPAIGAFLVVFIPIWLADASYPELSPVLFGGVAHPADDRRARRDPRVGPPRSSGGSRRRVAPTAAPPRRGPDALASATH